MIGVLENDSILSVQLLQLGKIGELRRDGAIELIRVKGPGLKTDNKGWEHTTMRSFINWFID